MNTAPLTRPGASSRTVRNAEIISQGARLRVSPRRPVAQNAHCIAQPTWEERHTV